MTNTSHICLDKGFNMLGIVSVTEKGDPIVYKLKDYFLKENIETICICKSKEENFSLKEVTEELFKKCKNLIFISSTGIAVRAISPFIVKKDKDPGVLVVDVNNNFTISLLGGHLGGANELSLLVSKVLNNTLVITTATDNQNKVAPDMVAKENNLIISDLKKAKDMASRLVNNKEVYFLDEEGKIKTPKGYKKSEVLRDNTLVVSNREDIGEKNFRGLLKLVRRNIVLGIGCRKGLLSEDLKEFVEETLKDLNIDKRAILKIGSIDIKRNERAILDLGKYLNCSFETFTKEEIIKFQDQFVGSDFVERAIGVRAVSEPSVLLMKGDLILNKLRKNGMTLSLGKLKE